MNIYNFINSRDIKEYLEKMNYQFTTLEAAWLIWQCESVTLKDKHAAWQKIINTMPDCDVPERINCRNWKSLHDLIRRYIAMETKYLEQFYCDESGVVYAYSEQYKDEQPNCDFARSKLCSSFEKACDILDFKNIKSELQCVFFQKTWLDSKKSIRVVMLPNGNVCSLSVVHEDTEEDADLLHYSFGGMYLLFPIPFKKGDIVCTCEDNRNFNTYYYPKQIAVLADDEVMWEDKRNNYFYCDWTDMNVHAYGQTEDGRLWLGAFPHAINTYMNIEYYRGELDGNRRVLEFLSRHLKGEIDAVWFADAYHIILEETKMKKMYHDYDFIMGRNKKEESDEPA